MLNQQYQEPFLAIVVDPVRTMASGKVEIGAFRTYPEGYKPPDEGPNEYQTIPLSKIEDFGVHAKQVRLGVGVSETGRAEFRYQRTAWLRCLEHLTWSPLC
jgi:hypothetical protein